MFNALWAINLLDEEIPNYGHQPPHIVDHVAQVDAVMSFIRHTVRQVNTVEQLRVYQYLLNEGSAVLTKDTWRITDDEYRRPGYLELIREQLQAEVDRIIAISSEKKFDVILPQSPARAKSRTIEFLPGVPWLKPQAALDRLHEIFSPYLRLTDELIWLADKHDFALLVHVLERHSFIPTRLRPRICEQTQFLTNGKSSRTAAKDLATQISRLNGRVPYLRADPDIQQRIKLFLSES